MNTLLEHSTQLFPGRLRFTPTLSDDELISIGALLYQRGFVLESPREVRGDGDLVCTFPSALSLVSAQHDAHIAARYGDHEWQFNYERDGVIDADGLRACTTLERSVVFLIGRTLDLLPPVTCGDCDGVVPVHLFPEEVDVESWARTYRNLVGLTLSNDYESWAEAELLSTDSYINLRAMALVRDMRAALQQVAYYRLELNDDQDRCPKCGDAAIKGTYRMASFVCDECALAW
ncbi:MAG TPA: DUF2310 family Zn-ribbon-containing protein [Thermoanaerobaculia bacterium]|jgi:hypothetical protein|nr:DUF2310 family Zn-ribbon-containing protein [Thermoanaerobaculia bacterium]